MKNRLRELGCCLFLVGCMSAHLGGEGASSAGARGGALEVTPASLSLPQDFLEDVQILDLGGESVHEADSKRPRFLRGVMSDVFERVALDQIGTRPLKAWITPGPQLPVRHRPADGYSGAIGAESYFRASRKVFPPESETPNRERFEDLKASLQLVSGQLSAVGFAGTEHLLKQFLLVRSKMEGAVPDLSSFPGGVETLLLSGGFWMRPEMSAWERRRGKPISAQALYTLGEQSLSRNRALVLLELLEKMSASKGKGPQQLLEELSGESDSEELMWVRTHMVVEAPPGSDLSLSLSKFSVLVYTFALIGNVTEEDFELKLLSYPFVHGEPVWNREISRKLVQTMCSEQAMSNLASEKQCQKLASVYAELGEPSFDALERHGLASWISVSGYGPVMLSQETVSFSILEEKLAGSLRQFTNF